MVGRKKIAKTRDEGSQEDMISKLPDALISDILYYLPTKDAVRTSVLSTRWRTLWQSVPGLDLDSRAFSKADAFGSFVERFFDSHKDSWIRKLQLCSKSKSYQIRSSWIDAVTTRRIQHLDLDIYADNEGYYEMPQSIYTCKTLVQLGLCGLAALVDAEFVSLPCLKVMRLEDIRYSNRATLEKVISGSLVLEDLTIRRCFPDDNNDHVLQVRSQTLKRIDIDDRAQVVIDAPLLQCLRTGLYSTNKYKIVGSAFPAKLDIVYGHELHSESIINDILTDISRVRDLVINEDMWEVICRYSKSRPLCQFRYLSRLSARVHKSDLEVLLTLLESCPVLESLSLEFYNYNNMEPKVTFSTVPRCLGSSLKFVEWKRSTKEYEGEMELLRYILKNSTVLEKLRLNVYYSEKAKCAFLTQLVAVPRCSSACQVIVSIIPRR